MSIEIQNKLKSNSNYIKYLRENSNWYKFLNRNDNYFKEFESEMKKNYHLNFSDRFENIINTIDMAQTIINTLN